MKNFLQQLFFPLAKQPVPHRATGQSSVLRSQPAWHLLLVALLGLFAFGLAPDAMAANATMPWDTDLTALRNNLSGTTATTIAIIGFIGSIGGLILAGGEIGTLGRAILFLVMAAALLLGANSYLVGKSGQGAEITHVKKIQVVPASKPAYAVSSAR